MDSQLDDTDTPTATPLVALAQPKRHRLGATLEVLLCCGLPTQLLVGLALGLIGLRPSPDGETLSLAYVATLSLLDTAVLLVLMVTFIRAEGRRPRDMWLGPRPFLTEAGRGLLHVPVVLFIAAAALATVRAVAPALHNVPVNPFEAFARGGLVDVGLLALVAIVAGGVREELQRAFILDRFARHLGGSTVGVVVSSIGFGWGHALQGWDVAVATGAIGAFWASIYVRRQSAVAPVISHATFNSLEVLRFALGGR